MNVVVPLPVAIEIRQETVIIEAECIYIENPEQDNIIINFENDSEINFGEKNSLLLPQLMSCPIHRLNRLLMEHHFANAIEQN